MPAVDHIKKFATAPAHSTAPDSVTTGGGFVWVAYTDGANSKGLSGESTIVQYDAKGHIVHTYTLHGYVDGLKFNPETGKVWALQNQDGNSTLSIIDPATHAVTGPLSYANHSSTRGYDDVVFRGDQVFLSYTNPPGTTGDPTVVMLTNGDNPHGKLKTETILTDGVTGFNTVTGTTDTVPLTDPDSMKLAPNGDLLLTSGADGVIVDIQNPGTASQAVAFTQIKGVAAGNAGLDDVIRPGATSGTFYLSDTNNNRVLAFHVTGLNVNDFYASVGSLGAFGQVDPTTGVFTPLIDASNAPGMTFSGPHGVTFVADKNAAPTALVDHIETLADGPAGSSMPDSITTGDGFLWVSYANGIPGTGGPGTSTIVQYDFSGNIVNSYHIAGSVDGLKFDPDTGKIWALQNQDGNSTLSLIDPGTGSVSGPFAPAIPSSSRGYDDVVFRGEQVFLSYSNPPGTTGDPTVVMLTSGDDPNGKLATKTVLTDGVSGFDTVTGTMAVVPQADPDSMKLAPNGDLLLTSGDDGVIIDIQNPGTPSQAVAFTPIQGVTPGSAGLDDVIKPGATSGTFYLTDTNDNRVLAFHVTGLNVNDYYASVGSLGAFGQVDPTTGVFTPIVSAENAPGFKLSGPHGVTFVPDAHAKPMPLVDHIATLADGPAGSTGPDSITRGDGFIWVAYTNGISGTGGPGTSTIVQYDFSGNIVNSYHIGGSVDGLKFDPDTGKIWALQNQDGNSTLSLIDPGTGNVSGPFTYAVASASRGYDDVVFKGEQVFLSETNPAVKGDATVVRVTSGDDPFGPISTTPVLTFGQTGIDTVTGGSETIPQADPDSMKLAPNGDLLLTSGDDGAIIDIKNPGASNQSVSFTPIQGVTPGAAGLDDVVKPDAKSGTFYLTDTNDNRVLAFHATGLNVNDYYAAVGSLDAFGQVDPKTGAFTPIVSAQNAPGFTLSAPHGVTFVPDGAQAAVAQLVQGMAVSFPAAGIGGSGTFDATQTHAPQQTVTSSHG
jgi:hypothetical protein